MNMPNFIVIGAIKSGTTALYHYLKQHPQIYMSLTKETNFFALESEKPDFYWPGVQERISHDSIKIIQAYRNSMVSDIETYRAQFLEVSNELAVGEASPSYLYSPKAAERIQQFIPNAKLIVILRNPVDRAYSNFLHCIRDGLEPFTDFAQALEEEKIRIQNNWWWGFYYLSLGLYYIQLKRYFEIFDKSQIKVYLYEDLDTNPIGLLHDTFRFLSVDHTFVPNLSTRYNATGIPKNKALHDLLTRSNSVKHGIKQFIPTKLYQQIRDNLMSQNLVKPQLAADLRRKLLEVYREDIFKLQHLIQRDLSGWLR